jgi:hypothetical protein
VKKIAQKRYVNPKYINIWGTYESELGGFITNEQLTKLFSEYGSIIIPVQDVHDLSENVWSIDKKNFRIDLDKGKHIPRRCPVEHTTKDDKIVKADLRVTYKDQPRFCRQCVAEHTGDCPLWLEKQKRLQEIKEQKEKDTKTLIIGDSNLEKVNSNALLADVVSSSGANIGHISNQLKFEKLDTYENIVIFAGINNIPAPNEKGDETLIWKQISMELDELESRLSSQAKKGKNIYLTQVTNAKHTSTPRAASLRIKINNRYIEMVANLRKKGAAKKAKVDIITWPVLTSEDDFEMVKAISEQATINYLHKVCKKVGDEKIRATYLVTKLTAYQYSNVPSTYPLGCYKCTAMNHSRDDCPADFTKKRQASSDLDAHPTKIQVTHGMANAD